MEKHLIINDWIKTYLIGAMEVTSKQDGGRGWRSFLREEFAKRTDKNGNPIYVFDPTLEEQNKIGMESETFHKKVKGWLASGKNEMIRENGELIWKGKTYIEMDGQGRARLVKILGDIDYVLNSNFLIVKIDKGDAPCGTFGEACLAVEHNIPIYVIQTMARTEYPSSFVHYVFISGGGFFTSEKELFEHIDKKFGLQIKK
jgi:hypothetical protein